MDEKTFFDRYLILRILPHSLRLCAPPENPGGLWVFAGKITCETGATSAIRADNRHSISVLL